MDIYQWKKVWGQLQGFSPGRVFFTTATFCDSCPTLFVQQAVSCVSCSFVLFQAGNMKIQTQIHPIVHMKILNEETEKMKLY